MSKYNIPIAIILIAVMVGVGAYAFMNTGSALQDKAVLPSMNLTLVALNGTQYVLNSTGIGALQSYTSLGGLVTSAGKIYAPINYTGIPLSTLCTMMGGFGSNISLAVTASDGYSLVYSYDELMGNIPTYDPVTGNEVAKNSTLTPILAYFCNGTTALPTNDGPLRLVYVGPEGLISDGHYWIKSVVKVELRPAIAQYTLTLNGSLYELMDRATFESGVNCHGENWTDSSGTTWTGIPLWLLVGRIDDSNAHEDRAFNRTLADLGYDVKIIAVDGYSITLNSTFVKLNNNILLANLANGTELAQKYWPLRLVGPALTSGQMIRTVTEIQLIFPGS